MLFQSLSRIAFIILLTLTLWMISEVDANIGQSAKDGAMGLSNGNEPHTPQQLLQMMQMMQSICGQQNSDPFTRNLCASYGIGLLSPTEDDNDLKINEEDCTRLPPRSSSSTNSSQMNLLDLLNQGSELMEASNTDEAILILGNTGSGKTTITQMIAGDLSRMHAVLTNSDSMVIIDDDNRIGAPTTVSKTLIPELVIPDDSTPSIYDCPGFDDTRGPVIDIATNYFLNQVVRDVSKAKLLFTVIHSSVKLGNDRLDFDLLVEHATKFVKNVPKYSQAIGLVVTKVNSFSGRGKYISDDKILEEITEFISEYNRTLHSKLITELDTNKKVIISEKISFIDALLQLDSNSSYYKISFSRDPEKCGSLSKSTAVAETRERVKRLYSDLQFIEIDPDDFGYSLKASSSLYIHDTVTGINKNIEKNIKLISKDFWFWQQNTLRDSDALRVLTKVEAITKGLATIKNLTLTEDSIGPLRMGEILKQSFNQLGYHLPSKMTSYLRRQERFLNFFDDAAGESVERKSAEWINSVEEMEDGYLKYQKWFEFCVNLQKKVFSYEYQLKKGNRVRENNFRGDWLDFVIRNDVMHVSEWLKEVASFIDDFALGALSKIMQFAEASKEILCDVEEKVTIIGNFIRFSDFLSKDGDLDACYGYSDVKKLEIYSADTIFIDIDLMALGKELEIVIIAPKWEVIGERKINLDGKSAKGVAPSRAGSGRVVAYNDYYTELIAEGVDGKAGLPGGPGGTLLGFASRYVNGENLTITANGGNGGKGQDGGNGKNGTSQRDSAYDDTYRESFFTLGVYTTSWRKHEGYAGSDGGNGGNGGVGGLPGKQGDIRVFGRNADKIKTFAYTGMFGQAGVAGKGGIGGESGRGLTCENHYVLFFRVKQTCDNVLIQHWRGNNGRAGADNKSQMGLLNPKPGKEINAKDAWKLIVNYRLRYYGNGRDETDNFIEENLNENSLSQSQPLKGFADELLNLEKVSGRRESLRKYYDSLIKRLEYFGEKKLVTVGEESDKKLFYLLLSSAYSSASRFSESESVGMVVDVGRYLNVVHQRLDIFRRASTAAVIEEERQRMSLEVSRKVKEVNDFISEIVSPSLDEAKVELKYKLVELSKQLDELILNGELKAKDLKMKIENDFSMWETINIRQIVGGISLIGSVMGWLPTEEVIAGWAVVNSIVSFSTGMISKWNQTGIRQEPEHFVKDLIIGARSILDQIENGTQIISEVDTEMMGDKHFEEHEFENSTLNWQDAISSFGEGVAYGIYKREQENEANLKIILEQAEKFVTDSRKKRLVLHQHFLPMVSNILSYFEKVEMHIKSKGSLSVGQLHLSKMKVSRDLARVKNDLEILGDGLETGKVKAAVDRVMDGLTLMIDLYGTVEQSLEAERMSDYMARISSAQFQTIKFEYSEIEQSWNRLEEAITKNILEKEYRRAIHAFRQWVFPFAKYHLGRIGTLQLSKLSINETASVYQKEISELRLKLEGYRAMTLSAQDTHVIHTNFSSEHKSSKPFYIWRGDTFRDEIRRLLSGEEVYLKADIRDCYEGRNAVKFKQIEINLKVADSSLAKELHDELEHLKVSMTHSGISYYKVGNSFYVMKGDNQTIQYNFERDSHGNRLGRNAIYNKFQNGDYLLSPYTLWKMKLSKAVANSRVTFGKLQRLAEVVDVELVGAGIYIGDNMNLEGLDVERYYERDFSIRENFEF